jgi:hypothetical protein
LELARVAPGCASTVNQLLKLNREYLSVDIAYAYLDTAGSHLFRISTGAATELATCHIGSTCQDEMRVGQKNKLTHRWARKGSRPRAVHDQRTQSTYLFGAVCPELGTGAALVLPACNSEAMQLHLDEIAIKVSPGAHAILLLDQAGWHGAKILKVPSNITLMPLPPRAPELNGQENSDSTPDNINEYDTRHPWTRSARGDIYLIAFFRTVSSISISLPFVSSIQAL